MLTIAEFQEWVRGHRYLISTIPHPYVEYVVCADGFEMSVQASANHYCHPREDWLYAYQSFEVGFPSAPDSRLTPYAEDPESLTDTVYGRVPVQTIVDVINAHGGLA